MYGSSELYQHEEVPEDFRFEPKFGLTVEGIHSMQTHKITGWHGGWEGRERPVTQSNQRPAIGVVFSLSRQISFKASFSPLSSGFSDEPFFKRVLVTGGNHDFNTNISVKSIALEIPLQASFYFIHKEPIRVGVLGGYNVLLPLKYQPEDWGEPTASSSFAEPIDYGPFERTSFSSSSLFGGVELAYQMKNENYIALNAIYINETYKQSYEGDKNSKWETKRLEFKLIYYYFFPLASGL